MNATLEGMKPVSDYSDMVSLHTAWLEWSVTELILYSVHAKNVSSPMPRESIHYRDEMLITTDALTWASELMAEADDFVHQAMGIATEDLTISQAEKVCHRYIRAYKGLCNLYKTAEKKLSCLQSLNRGG